MPCYEEKVVIVWQCHLLEPCCYVCKLSVCLQVYKVLFTGSRITSVEYLHQTPSTSCPEARSWLFMNELGQASSLVEVGHDCKTQTVPGRCNCQLDRSLFLAYPLQSLHVNFPLYLKIVLMKIYYWLDTF